MSSAGGPIAWSVLVLVAASVVGCRSTDAYADCEPGESYLAGCSAAVGNACTGDPRIRVCTDAVSPGDCADGRSEEIGYDDDSGDGQCPEAEFVCPPSGRVAVNTETADRDFCEFGLLMIEGPPPPPMGVEQACTAATTYEVGCTSMLGTPCTGDPTLAICTTDADPCDRASSFEYNDDSDGRCPLVEFECPASGRVVVLAAPFGSSTADFTCTWALREVPPP